MDSFALLDAVFRHAPVGLAFWDADLRYRRINEQLAQIHGVPVADHLGRTAPDVLGALGEELHERLERILRTGEAMVDVEVSGEIPATPGRRRHWLASWYPVTGSGGRPVGVGAVVLETTRERAALERAEALSRTAAALANSVQPDAVLEAVAAAAVPQLADWCAIHVAREGFPVALGAVAHVDPARRELAYELNRRYPPRPEDGGATTVIRTGRPVIRERIPDEMLAAAARDDEHLRIMRELGLSSGAVLPLTARGVVLGAITLMFAESGRTYTPELLDTAEALAAQAAIALDNATLYAEQAGVAQALQRSLLPARLPEIAGVELAARYRPAGRMNAVGGDFYGIWPDGRGAWRVAVGDVAGKGADAAAITALVRHTLHAGTLRGDDVCGELTLASDALLAQRDRGMYCTAVYGRLTPGDGTVRLDLACAGHPPPLLLRADGSLEDVAVRGSVLGLERGMTYTPVTVELDPGDALLLYTDGATELRGLKVPAGEAALRELVRGLAGAGADELVEAVEHHVLVESGGTPRDDLALLALRRTP